MATSMNSAMGRWTWRSMARGMGWRSFRTSNRARPETPRRNRERNRKWRRDRRRYRHRPRVLSPAIQASKTTPARDRSHLVGPTALDIPHDGWILLIHAAAPPSWQGSFALSLPYHRLSCGAVVKSSRFQPIVPRPPLNRLTIEGVIQRQERLPGWDWTRSLSVKLASMRPGWTAS